MPVYPGDPTPELIQSAVITDVDYNEYTLKTGMHVGTHIDAPLHMVDGGKRISDFGLDAFIGRGHLIDARGKKVIDEDLLTGHTIKKNDIVLVMTGWYKKYRDPEYYTSHPEFTENFANKVISLGVKLIGTDTPSPDRPPYPIHKILLSNNILIIENLTNLEPLLTSISFEIYALPLKLDADAALVRVIAKII